MTSRLARARWLPGALVAAVTLAAFLPALGNGFVNWDDDENFLWNPHYRGLAWANLRWMFTSAQMGHYIPVTWLTLGLDYELWGMSPMGYHASSIVLHAANAVLVYLLARRLLDLAFQSRDHRGLYVGAAVSALLFSAHPLRVESVAWVTERRDLVGGLFTLLTVLSYLRACRRGVGGRLHPGWYWTSVALFALALLSKSIVVGLPLVLLALDVYPLRRVPAAERGLLRAVFRYGCLEKAPFLGLSAAVSALAALIASRHGAMTSLETLGIIDRLAITGYGLAFYLRKMLAPWPLSPLYTLFLPVTPWSMRYLLPGAVVLLITTVMIAWRRRWPAGLLTWACYVVLLLPVSGILHNGPQIAADRYTYLAAIGWALLAGGGAVWCFRSAGAGRIRPGLARSVVAVAVVVVVGLIALTVRQVAVWRDSVTLWRHAAAVEPDSDIPIFYLGRALTEKRRFDEARAHFTRSLARVPARLPELRAQFKTQLGIVEQRSGNLAEAERDFREALALDPGHPVALIRLGVVRLARGDTAAAREVFSRATELMAPQGRYKNWELREAIEEIPPALPEDRGRLAFALGLRFQQYGALDQAEEQYRVALSLLPGLVDAWNSLGVVHALRGQKAEALQAFLQALRVAPAYAAACGNARRAAAELGVSPRELAACPGA